MNRIKVPSGSIQKLETIFENLQDQTELNISNRIDALTNLVDKQYSYGIILNTVNGATSSADTSLLLQLTTGYGGWTIAGGHAVTQGKDYIAYTGVTDADSRVDPIYNMSTSKYYLVKLIYSEVGSEPVTTMNAFLFDKTGSEPYTDKMTKKTDSVSVGVLDITANYSAGIDLEKIYPDLLTSNEIGIAIVKTSTSSTIFDTTTFIIDGVSSVNGVLDIRKYNRFILSSSIIDDSKILLKDRDSIGDYKIGGAVEIDGDLIVTGDSSTTPVFKVDQVNERLGKGTSTPTVAMHIKDSDPIIRLHDSDATLTSEYVGYIDFYKGTEAAFSEYSDRLALIGFKDSYSTVMYIQNDTLGSIAQRVCLTADPATEIKTWATMTWAYPGRLGLLQDTPLYTLDVSGTARVTGAAVFSDTVNAKELEVTADINVGGDIGVTGLTNLSDDLNVSDSFSVDVSASQVVVGAIAAGTDLIIKNPLGPRLKLETPGTGGAYKSAITFSDGTTNPNTFVLAVDAATNSMRIDRDLEFSKNYLAFDASGNVIINDISGTYLTNPVSALDRVTVVNGGIYITKAEHNAALKLQATGSGQRRYDIVVGTIPEYTSGGRGMFGIYDYNEQEYRFVIDPSGRIGINGVTRPVYQLDVDGTIHSTSDVVIDGDLTVSDATFDSITTGALTVGGIIEMGTMSSTTSVVSSVLKANTIRWPKNSLDVNTEGSGFLAGVTSDGVVTIGGTAFGSGALANVKTYPDYLRVLNSLRIYSDQSSQLSFSTDTVTSGISLIYSANALTVAGSQGVYQTFHTMNSLPTVDITDLSAGNVTITGILDASLSTLVTSAISASSLDIGNVLKVTTADTRISTAYITTDNVTDLNVTGLATLVDLDVSDITASGVVSFNTDVTVTGELTAGDFNITGSGIFGNPVGQHIELTGAEGNLYWYNEQGAQIIKIDDNLFGSHPGIGLYGSDYPLDQPVGTQTYCPVIIVSDSIANNTNLVGITPYDVSIKHRKDRQFGLTAQNMGSYAGESTSVLAWTETFGDRTGAVYDRIGIKALATISNTITGPTETVTTVASNDNAIGLFASASTNGTGHAYAGYFDEGDVIINDNLTVCGNLTCSGVFNVTGTTSWNGDLAHAGTNVGFYGATPTTRKTGYSTTGTGLSASRNLAAVGSDFDALKNVVKGLIDDLIAVGLLGN
ncbi:MAG TPA: hypothetical protein PKN48_00415 [Bacteroidales bacterium]|nr:hypothetical protein [Bacteroidales bacterium]